MTINGNKNESTNFDTAAMKDSASSQKCSVKEYNDSSFERNISTEIPSSPNERFNDTSDISSQASSKQTDAGENGNLFSTKTSKASKKNCHLNPDLRNAIKNEEDLYLLCCVDPNASSATIKSVFKHLALVLHPDKRAAGVQRYLDKEWFKLLPDLTKMSDEDIERHFCRVRTAYEILMDESSRAKYDSIRITDNYLPQFIDVNDFYNTVDMYFQRESYFCIEQPAPKIGYADTPISEVRAFYKYWKTCTSWRDFSVASTYQLQDAQSRDDKKWALAENWKIINTITKHDRNRLMKFVLLCEKLDPRLNNGEKQQSVTRGSGKPGIKPVKKVIPTSTIREQLQCRMKQTEAAKDARPLIKSIYKRFVLSCENHNPDKKIYEDLQNWLKTANSVDIIRLNYNLDFELMLHPQPDDFTARRITKIVADSIYNDQSDNNSCKENL